MSREGPLHGIHAAAAAEMGEFFHWHLPSVYSGMDREFEAARERAAVVDLSCFGKLMVRGKDRVDLLHRLSSNDLQALAPGHIVETLLLTDKGRLIDVLEVWVLEGSLLLRVSPANEAVVRHWIEKYTITEEIEVDDVTDVIGEICLIGPRVNSVVNSTFGREPSEGGFLSMHMPAGEVHLGAMKHDQTPFIRVLGGNEAIVQCWKDLLSRSNETGLRQMGMEAYDALRISLGIPAAGHEIAESFNPYDAGLRQDISFTKGCYIGQEVIARLDTYQKIRHRPMGLVLSRGGAPGPGRVVLEKNGGQVGWLTSATRLPVRKKYLGLGIVNVDNVREGDQLEATVDGTPVHCVALNLPLLP